MSAAQKRLALYIVVSIILLGSMYMNASLMLTSGKDQTNLAETVVRKDDQRRFLVVQSILDPFFSSKEGIAELMYLAYKTGRILVEPRMARIDKNKKDVYFAFEADGEGIELTDASSFRNFIDMRSIQEKFSVEMITFTEYLHEIEKDSSSIEILDYQFEPPPSSYNSKKGPAICSSSNGGQSISAYYAEMGKYIKSFYSSLHSKWKSECFPFPATPYSLTNLVQKLSLDSDVHSIVVSGYVGGFRLLDPATSSDDMPDPSEWHYSTRLEKKAEGMITKSASGSKPDKFAALLLESHKIWTTESPYSVSCAANIVKSTNAILQQQNIRTIFVSADFYKRDNSPYMGVMKQLKESSSLNVIYLDDFSDVDKAFLDEILCVKSDLFLFGDEESLGPDKCTSWTSIYAYHIIGHRNGKKEINLSDFV